MSRSSLVLLEAQPWGRLFDKCEQPADHPCGDTESDIVLNVFGDDISEYNETIALVIELTVNASRATRISTKLPLQMTMNSPSSPSQPVPKLFPRTCRSCTW